MVETNSELAGNATVTDDVLRSRVRMQAFLSACLILLILVADQLIKCYVKTHFLLHESIDVTGWFKILFIENSGMAFGMDFIGTMFLTMFRLVAVVFFCWVLAKVLRRGVPTGFVVCLSMIIAGAAGNIIDNCFYGLIFSESTAYSIPADFVPFGDGYGKFLEGRVVDMFYFPLFTWPDWMPLVGGKVFFGAIFNLADAAISCGAVAIVVFYYRYIAVVEKSFALKQEKESPENDA